MCLSLFSFFSHPPSSPFSFPSSNQSGSASLPSYTSVGVSSAILGRFTIPPQTSIFCMLGYLAGFLRHHARPRTMIQSHIVSYLNREQVK